MLNVSCISPYCSVMHKMIHEIRYGHVHYLLRLCISLPHGYLSNRLGFSRKGLAFQSTTITNNPPILSCLNTPLPTLPIRMGAHCLLVGYSNMTASCVYNVPNSSISHLIFYSSSYKAWYVCQISLETEDVNLDSVLS
jgi:hypothetical protein